MSCWLGNIPADYLPILIPIQSRAPYANAVGIRIVRCNTNAAGVASKPSFVWLEDIVVEI